ncbi:SDR family NAD(P)-dependent oxidoreductase [Stappia sp. BW2]|uniref:SDR family NAD(P)-dependent oxidoreductase n=1 Tax=Stappia sp. BW2 TaxID=2592622 RepID=UPI0011DE83AD|nr:SDR family NAD(P)-dependent oxidoreductase [Stappia sp. BW2]TYC65875.1 SDR family NAD(P)-dependent oxidoreductase [Stappia sp. BW2]
MPKTNYVARPDHGCAWITGASSGIGRELALDLARSGWTVVVTARSEKKLAELEKQSEELSGAIHSLPGDVTKTDVMAEHVKKIVQDYGGLALLVANAGVYLPQDGLDADTEAFRKSFDVNLMGTVNVLVPAIAAMKAAGRGQIAVVASVAGYGGLPTSAAYGATKAGLTNLVESLKFDLDLAGIRLQIINPGFVDTPATQSNPFPMPYLMSPEEAVQEIRKGLSHPSRFEIAFPRKFVLQLKVLRWLPYSAYFAQVARSTGWNKKQAG